MKIEIDLNINFPALSAFLAAAGGEVKAAAPKATTKTAPKATPEPAKEEPTPEAEPAAEQTDEAGVDIGAVKLAATSYSAKNGRDALAALIKDHGGTAGISSIPEQNRAAFVAQAEG